jgi:hypothetical protein
VNSQEDKALWEIPPDMRGGDFGLVVLEAGCAKDAAYHRQVLIRNRGRLVISRTYQQPAVVKAAGLARQPILSWAVLGQDGTGK